MTEILLEMNEIRKTFSGVAVLDNAKLEVKSGESVGLLGSNGAGKSTLIKILSGVYSKDRGKIKIKGNEISINNPSDAIKNGIGLLPQELSIHSELSVAENLLMGNLPTKKILGVEFTDKNELKNIATRELNNLGLDIDVSQQMKNLSLPEQRIVEIARAMVGKAQILIMDEPTAALTSKETETLFNVLENVRKTGVGIIYISHYLDEVFDICQKIVVLRDGLNVGNFETSVSNHNEVLAAMLGSAVEDLYPTKKEFENNDIALSLHNVTFSNQLFDLNFNIRKGEIFGVFGLLGSGLEELGRNIYGVNGRNQKGQFKIFGEKYVPINPRVGKKFGIGFIPAERKTEGILSELSLRKNITIPFIDNFLKNGILQENKEKKFSNKWIEEFDIKCLNSEQLFKFLSGGNQQKACIARWLVEEVKLLIVEEPTRGVDLGARKEIYSKLRDLCEDGLTILVLSSDVEEIHGLADRYMVLNRGKIKNIFEGKVSVETLMAEAGENIKEITN